MARKQVSARTRKSDGCAVSSPKNGRKGGRPPGWSKTILRAAVACLRRHARGLADPLAEEMVRLARAFEEGTLRLRGRSVARAEAAPAAPQRTDMRVEIMLRVHGGKSARGRDRAEEEVVDGVLRQYRAKRHDEGFDYSLVVPYSSEEALDRLMSLTIPTSARAIAARRHCKVEYSARSVDEPGRTWIDATPPPPVRRQIELELALMTGRRGNRSVAEIEARVLGRFSPVRLPKSGEYRLTVRCSTDEELEHEVAQLVADMRDVTRDRACLIAYEVETVQLPRRTWTGELGRWRAGGQ